MDWQKLLEYQPVPGVGGKEVYREVFAALLARIRQGVERYGTLLKTNNGRDALADALQEQLDGVQYLVQAIMEREERRLDFERRVTDCANEILGFRGAEDWESWAIGGVLRKYFSEKEKEGS